MHGTLHPPRSAGAQHVQLVVYLSDGEAAGGDLRGDFPRGESPAVLVMRAECPSIVWWMRVVDDEFGAEEI
jgi:hypothetical protein